LDSELWGLEELRDTIRKIDPDVVCVELADDNLAAALGTWSDDKTVDDKRVLRFPEYVQVLLPLMDEMQFVVEPAAQWHEILDAMRRGKVADFNTQERYAKQRADYEVAKAWADDWLKAQPHGISDDPFYIHSAEFDLHAKVRSGAYDFFLNAVIGRPMGWTYVHDEHYEKIMDAVRKHPGKKVLVTFGVNHIYWFHELLRWNPDVELMDVRPYLPGGDDWQRSEEEIAIDEFHAGIDCLRVVWAHFRGDKDYALARIDRMLELPDGESDSFMDNLKAGRGLVANEFMNGPLLGRPEVVASGGDWWQIRVAVRRFGDTPDDATWISARLRKDGTRPGGFAWTTLEVPEWLLHLGDTLSR